MYTNFFKAVPQVFIEAARLDGASDLKIMYRIMLPMSKSITTVIFLFLLMERWTELLWDMIAVRAIDADANVLRSQCSGLTAPSGTVVRGFDDFDASDHHHVRRSSASNSKKACSLI